MAINQFRGDPRGSARSRRAAYSSMIGPQVVSGSVLTTTGVSVDDNGLLALGTQTGELIPVNANQVINGIYTVQEGPNGTVGGWRKLQFGAGCVLVYNADNFVLPGDASIVTVDGDTGIFYCFGGTAQEQGEWECVQFTRGGVPPNPGYGVVIAYDMWGGPAQSPGTGYIYTPAGNGGPGDTLTIPLTAAAPNPMVNGQTMSEWVTGYGIGAPLFFSDFPQAGVYTYTSGDGSATPFVWTRADGLCVPSQFIGSVVAVIFPGATENFSGLWTYDTNTVPTFDPSSEVGLGFIPAITNGVTGQFYIGDTGGYPQPATLIGDLEFVGYATGAAWNEQTVKVQVCGIQGVAVSNTAPTAGQVLSLVSGSPNTWTPTTLTPVGWALNSGYIWIGSASNVAAALPISGVITLSSSGVTAFAYSTGSGAVVLATSPSLVTPALGTPASGNFSTGTFTWPTFNQSTTGNAATATTASSATTASALTNGGTLNTPASGTLTNCSGLPLGGYTVPPYILIREQEASGTNGGTFTSGANQTRVLTTIVHDDTGSVTLSSNEFVLPAGTYEIMASAPGVAVNDHQAWLYNVTGSSVVLVGSSEYASNTYLGSSRSVIMGKFTIAASQSLCIQHRCSTTQTTNGFGVAGSFATPDMEIYTVVALHKVA